MARDAASPPGPLPPRRSSSRLWHRHRRRAWPRCRTAALRGRRPAAATAALGCRGPRACSAWRLLLWPTHGNPARLARTRREAGPGSRSRGPVLFGIVANVVAWVGYGLASGCSRGRAARVRRSRSSLAIGGLRRLLRRRSASRSSRPGGLGVREGLFIACCRAASASAPPPALAVASRLLLTITELGAAVPFLLSASGTVRVSPEPDRASRAGLERSPRWSASSPR